MIESIQPLEFAPWPKTPRLFREVTITEKIDGTNAAVVITRFDGTDDPHDFLAELNACAVVHYDNQTFLVGAQSRKKLVRPGKATDNYGFAAWVRDNAFGLAVNLGVGIHYGEWWGSGIQRGYDQTPGMKIFSLFNVHRYGAIVRNNALTEDGNEAWVPNLRVVPTLSEGIFSEELIRETLRRLENVGSQAAPGYGKPEGLIVFHSASRQVYKVLLDSDELPKGLVA